MFFRKSIDFWVTIPTAILLIIGTVVIASVSPDNLTNHLTNIGLAMFSFIFFFISDRTILYSLANYLYIFGLFGLILPLILGTITRGSIRWIDLGIFTIQPSEIIKLIITILSATYWTNTIKFAWKKLILYLIIVVPPVVLVLVQPDLGSALVIIVCIATTILLSGISLKQVVLFTFGILLLMPIGWVSLHDYQHQRIINFIDPYRDPLGSGYNAIQAKIAVGSGNIVGRGIGRGTQSHLAFLPERHTDFVFASFAEETGFVGALLVLISYILLFFRILKLTEVVTKPDKIVLTCLVTMLFFQVMVNIGMNIGVMPIAGVTLPLVSYGGSSLIITMACLGLICNISSSLHPKNYLRIS